MTDVADLLGYLSAAPSPYHAVAEARRRLADAGFAALDPAEAWPEAPGRYLVAVLLEGPADFTVHSSLPGQFEVGRRPLDLGQIVLTRADSELDLGLDPDSWTAQGKAGFLTGAEGPYLRLDANSSASRFVGTVPYLHKTVRFQVVSRGSGRLRVSLYTKGAGLKTEEIGQLAGERSVHEVELNAGPVPGYFQVSLEGEDDLIVYAVRLEVAADD